MSGMIYVRPFGQVADTVNLTADGVVAVPRSGMGTQSIRICNLGSTTIFLQFGKDATVAANSTTSMPMLPGTVEVFLLPNDITNIACVGISGTVYFTTGESA